MFAVALEGALVFGVLYLLTATTVAIVRDTGAAPPFGFVAGFSVLFVASLGMVRGGRPNGEILTLRQEVALASAVSLVLGSCVFLARWALTGSPQMLAAILTLEGTLAVPATVAAWRWIACRFGILDGWRERILVIGTGETARRLSRWVSERLSQDHTIVGFADADESRIGNVVAMGVRVQTSYSGLLSFCPKRADRIVVALDEKRGTLPIHDLVELRLAGFEIEDTTSFLERTSGKLAVETLLPSWLIFSGGFKTSPARVAIKRVLDVALSVGLLIVASPVMLAAAAAIRLDSPGPVLYRQKRLGLKGKEFFLLKFRSMVRDAERKSGPVWAREGDPRVTRVGRLLRATRIDELPQIFNVLGGQMSFVGPRPERRHFVEQLEKSIPFYRLRTAVRPGVTGWAQVMYRYGASEEDAVEKLKYDLYYVKHLNPLFDLWIVLKTIKVVLSGDGAR